MAPPIAWRRSACQPGAVNAIFTKTAVSWGEHIFPTRSTFHSSDLLGIRMMSNWLLAVAWGSALASLYLIADMVMTDFACRRAERVHARRRTGLSERFSRR